VDFAVDPHNSLNKESDATTGWSDHGARWLAPETGRWLTPDPPVKAPDPKFLADPWALHPYQYVSQNPVRFWDPDGRDKYSINNVAPRLPELGKPPTEREPGKLENILDHWGPMSSTPFDIWGVVLDGPNMPAYLMVMGGYGVAWSVVGMWTGIGLPEYQAQQDAAFEGQRLGRAIGFVGGYMGKYAGDDGLRSLFYDYRKTETNGANTVRNAGNRAFNEGLREGIYAHKVMRDHKPNAYRAIERDLTEKVQKDGGQPGTDSDLLYGAAKHFVSDYTWKEQK
jgi:RHS repeat-associated protein